MNSPFANIFQSLRARMLTVLQGDTLLIDTPFYIAGGTNPVLAYIDMDYGQLETRERPSVAFPCMIIKFHDFTFKALGNLAQEALGRITLKLATDPYYETSSITPDTYVQAALGIQELEWRLYKLLEGWSPAVAYNNAQPPVISQNAKPLTRIESTTDDRRPGLKVCPITFKCAFTDYSAKITLTNTNPVPNITPGFSFPT